jgi:hypothetical protein
MARSGLVVGKGFAVEIAFECRRIFVIEVF